MHAPRAIAKDGTPPGIEFEKITAAIQQQMDPAALVTHNERIVDRLGHSRQFDVVIRGTFAGQPMVGVIECKDYKGKVGTPDIDAFATKSQDINANFKILVSRRGFSKPALEKCQHYGIQALSLTIDDPANKDFFIGSYWKADLPWWNQLIVDIVTLDGALIPEPFAIEDVAVRGSRVLDWFTNYLGAHLQEFGDLQGPILDMALLFHNPELIAAGAWTGPCTALRFRGERSLRLLEYPVGITGPGFFDWVSSKVTFPPGATIVTQAVPKDFSLWKPRPPKPRPETGFITMKLVGSQFAKVEGVFDLESIGTLKWATDGAWRPLAARTETAAAPLMPRAQRKVRPSHARAD